MNNDLVIRQATLDDIDDLAAMFNEYRQFYRQPDNLEQSKTFLQQRLEAEESIAFIASHQQQPSGFVHLYPTYSSVHLKKIWILNDLYVRSTARRKGVGFGLLDAAKTMAKETGALCLKASSAQNNFTSQQVYEAKGYQRDRQFFHYVLPLMH
ncbi:GNAT family N-acetyltransferase [Pleionea sp. CnH1-48]|uniref:GNAT family N-acetyltransferase n=1 Tax=Pleionea sp. CnH1-48 TaxID=2954494 RepID=UPI002097BE0F|nr:GNAT family N-acetyltransferase [Pleionea sp. CnH1-48]MCO7225682.1 GNAT family N-acetyltransferase [Pleionea sp. CnH1-48]